MFFLMLKNLVFQMLFKFLEKYPDKSKVWYGPPFDSKQWNPFLLNFTADFEGCLWLGVVSAMLLG